jgi:ADP-ribose pyrophosphatase YjhB (NUDIX family)
MKDMTATLIIKNKKILLVHNTKHNGLRIEPPGGKREGNEDLENCIIREVKEELGITIRPIKLFGIFETNSPEGDFKVYMYFSEIEKGLPTLMEPDKISKFDWYSFEDMKKLKEQGVLVPNLCSALDNLKKYL